MRVPKGLLFHDPRRWKLYLAPEGTPEESLLRWLDDFGLSGSSPVPPVAPRTRQMFWVSPDHSPSREIRSLPGSRYSCVGCGKSCRSLLIGPLPYEDVQRLLKHDWSGTGYDPATFFVDQWGDVVDIKDWAGSCDLYLRRNDRACMFLRADNLCDVHVRFGERGKPQLCRMFPYFFRATPGGMLAGMRLGECRSAARTSQLQLVSEQRGQLEEMLSEVSEVALLPPSVWLTPDQLISWEEYEQMEAAADYDVRAFLPRHEPGPEAELEELVKRASAGADRPFRVLDAEAAALEDRLCRQAVFNKDLFLAPDLAAGAAFLVLKRFLIRREAADGAVGSLNDAWGVSARIPMAELCNDLDVRGMAARALGW